MAQKKAHEVDAWLARRDLQTPIMLFYGPDRGLVAERARAVAAATGLAVDDPFSVVRLDAQELEQTPGRLIDEASTVPMFSKRRLIWIRNAGAHKSLAAEIKVLAERPSSDAIIIVEAGELKKGAPLRSNVEAAAHAMALPCYADEARGLDGIIDEELSKANMSIALDARHALKVSLGGDRLASRGEIEKLVLYAAGQGQITLDDVGKMTGDIAALSLDAAIDAVLEGSSADFDAAFSRLGASQASSQLLGWALRQFHVLELMRGAMDADGRGAASVVAAARPPVFFSRRRTVEKALQHWSGAAITRALGSLQAAILQVRRRADLAEPIARQALLALTVESARQQRRH
ncbi:DNA polymerase III subunit delta [Mesorhizobium sp. NBSH29]|uniref:DNA polymerase III subunit delta n=1 Tax=Mesorhizobium sp. NBSH29 TaxID=2654249 RepID=UPI0018966D1A|nr:DNA polymerase III subunit delta [Mesorhizobium sp. NBSH29]QPC86067.1 DNA polymerase III subunit delta [Mesorhizobium sp. NBSH29]